MTKNPEMKVCGLTRPDDVRAAVALGADYIGFIVAEESPRFVSPERAVVLAEKGGADRCVAVTLACPADSLCLLDSLGFSYFQVHFDIGVSEGAIRSWSETVGWDRLWLAPRMSPGTSEIPEVVYECAETILVDAYSEEKYGGTGKRADWDQFSVLRERHPDRTWALAGGLNPENIREAIDRCQPDIVDVNSGIETSPGLKSHELMWEFFRAARGEAGKTV